MTRRMTATALLLLSCLAAPLKAKAEPPPTDISDVVRKLLPTVVNISTETALTTDAPGTPRRRETLGSGFIIDSSGLILTCAHVIEGSYAITVTLQDQTELRATLLAGSRIADVAVLKITASKPLPTVKLGDSDDVKVGQPVFVIGNPGGLGGSVTAGIVSAVNRNISISSYDDYIQTDASINHGNSGGPMFNLAGEVIGMNATIYSPSNTSGSIGLGFAIPANDLKFTSASLIHYGRINSGYFGLGLQQMTADVATSFGRPDVLGAIVTYVVPASAAATAGFEIGDVLLRIGAQPLSDSRAAMRAIAETEPGTSTEVQLWRDHKLQTLRIRAQDPPAGQEAENGNLVVPAPEAKVNAPDLGMKLTALNDYIRGEHRLRQNQTGVLVTEVVPFNVADDRGIKAGDVLVRADTEQLSSPADVTAYFDRLRAAKAPFATLLVQGSRGRVWVALPLAGTP